MNKKNFIEILMDGNIWKLQYIWSNWTSGLKILLILPDADGGDEEDDKDECLKVMFV